MLVENGLDLDGGRVALRVENGVHAPERLAVEGHDLLLTVDDQAQGDGLDTTGGEPRLDLAPEDRRKLETDEAVEDAAGLLRVDEVHVDVAGMLDGREYRIFRDLVEDNPAGILPLESEGLEQVPGNRLSFAVLIGCEQDRRRLGCRAAEFRHQTLLVVGDDILRREPVFHVDAQTLVLKIPDVAAARFHHVIISEIPSDGVRLGRRLHNH